ncbi:MAG: LytTR family transcriptional regulator DNA-binding domain-containing protein [Gammaproteobacteria bacterium]|nr:LytTR family transcriptional regulator DNA-binding domain-containing protein [Gammaproteobacteria bacterium]MCF6230811.1 LytTR family transcriptional regulator DNA-binding domain-containing protein [Gammaproteobacteria bacterium]
MIPCVSNNRIKFIKPKEIEYVRSDVRGIYVMCADSEYYTDLTLAALESKTELFRCHRQHLINVTRIDELVLLENGLAEIKTKSEHTVAVSRHYLKQLKKRLGM